MDEETLRRLLKGGDKSAALGALSSAVDGQFRELAAVASERLAEKPEDPELCEALLRAVGYLGAAGDANLVGQYVAAPSAGVRLAALKALARLRVPSAFATFVRSAVEDPDAQVRGQMLDLLGTIEPAPLEKRLLELLGSSREWVRKAAVKYAAKVLQARGLTVLEAAVRSGDARIGPLARQGIERLADEGHESARALMRALWDAGCTAEPGTPPRMGLDPSTSSGLGPNGDELGPNGEASTPGPHLGLDELGPNGDELGPNGDELGRDPDELGPGGDGLGRDGEARTPGPHLGLDERGPNGDELGPNGDELGRDGDGLGPDGDGAAPGLRQSGGEESPDGPPLLVQSDDFAATRAVPEGQARELAPEAEIDDEIPLPPRKDASGPAVPSPAARPPAPAELATPRRSGQPRAAKPVPGDGPAARNLAALPPLVLVLVLFYLIGAIGAFQGVYFSLSAGGHPGVVALAVILGTAQLGMTWGLLRGRRWGRLGLSALSVLAILMALPSMNVRSLIVNGLFLALLQAPRVTGHCVE